MTTLLDPQRAAVAKDLLTALSDDAASNYNDMVLVSQIDGGHVPAIRFVLAARSSLFRTMLYGNFREAQQNDIPLEFTAETLEAIVHFCSFQTLPSVCRSNDVRDHDAESVARLIEIATAADYFSLADCKVQTEQAIQAIMSHTPHLACVVLERLPQTAAGDRTCLAHAALVVIESRPYAALPLGITYLSPSKVEKVLRSSALAAGEWFLFQLLAHWHAGQQSKNHMVDDATTTTRQICSRCIRFANIEPSVLVTLQKNYPWVLQADLFAAVATQAVRASQRRVWSLDVRGGATTADRVLVEQAGTADCNGLYYRIAPGLLSNGRSDLYSKRELACGQQYVYTLSRRLLSRTVARTTTETAGGREEEESYYECRIFRNPFLTYNAVHQLEAMQVSSTITTSFQPVLQVIAIERPTLEDASSTSSLPTPIRQYHHVRVSDGSKHMHGWLSAELSRWVDKKELCVHHVIQVHEFGMYKYEGCAGIHIIRARIVTTAPLFRFGDPQPLLPTSSIPAPSAPAMTGSYHHHQNLYTCEYPLLHMGTVPQSMWLADEGLEPAPDCLFIPSQHKGEQDDSSGDSSE